jgi:hypothetical protein
VVRSAHTIYPYSLCVIKKFSYLTTGLVVGGWWLVVGGWWLVVGGWWLVVGGWWLVVGSW